MANPDLTIWVQPPSHCPRGMSPGFSCFCDSLNAMSGQFFKIVEYIANFSIFSVVFYLHTRQSSDVPNICSITRAFPAMYQVSTGSLTITGEIIELGTLNLFWNFSTKFDRFWELDWVSGSTLPPPPPSPTISPTWTTGLLGKQTKIYFFFDLKNSLAESQKSVIDNSWLVLSSQRVRASGVRLLWNRMGNSKVDLKKREPKSKTTKNEEY